VTFYEISIDRTQLANKTQFIVSLRFTKAKQSKATMADVMLILGSGLLAFGPFLSLFASVVYAKAQLVIVVTTAAFFFLLGSLAASLVWTFFDTIGLGGGLAVVIPGVFFQFIFRCLFVSLYHKVEGVIQLSLQQSSAPSDEPIPPSDNQAQQERQEDHSKWQEAAKLRLQLNDASCGVAAGCGYGGMHAILLYGTLLASESGGAGVLYQESCPAMPSLVVSALYAFFFTILDVFWMLFTFFGMRRRLMFHRGQYAPDDLGGVGRWLGNSRNGGNMALLACLATHFLASFATLTNYFGYGCVVSLPLVAGVVLLVAYLFWAGVGRIYMPPIIERHVD
jgi:hypothetical protein